MGVGRGTPQGQGWGRRDWQQLSVKVPFDENPLEGCHQPDLRGLGRLRPKNYQVGIETPPDNWVKALLSKALPTRARSSFSHHLSLPSRSLHKQLSLLHQRADRRSKKKHNPTSMKQNHITES